MKGFDYSASLYLGRQLHTADSHKRRGSPEKFRLKADVVIAGSGPGGLAAGCALGEAGLDVVVLEAGSFWRPQDFVRDMNFAQSRLYQENATRVMQGNVFIPLTSGRGVGGGTLVNSAICFRTPDWVLDEWVQDWGVDLWRKGPRDRLYDEVEEAIGVVETSPAIAGTNSEIARRGFSTLNVEHGYMPRNAGGCAGCGTCHTGCPSGGKASADLNWLPRMLRAGGRLYADTRVEEILVDRSGNSGQTSGQARGLRGIMRDPETGEALAEVTVEAERVLLACGTINTPMLLQRQNLANSSGALGRFLHVHPAIALVAKMEEDVLIWKGATQGYYAHHPDDPQVLAETFSAPPDAMLSQSAMVGYEATEFLRDLRYMAGCGAVIRDESTGEVTRKESGRADIRYFVEETDRKKFQRGMELIANMFFAAGAKGVMPMIAGAPFYNSLNQTLGAIRRATNVSDLGLYASHPMGTCRMHPDPSIGVVRPRDGMTHDVENLHVVDASVFPTALGANPQMTIMGTALAMAREIAES
jgi:choline dehydrogenase-like flavoprotein